MYKRFLSIVCLLFMLCSCKSLRPSINHNTNTSSSPGKKRDTKFLDNISIQPGDKKSNYAYSKGVQSNKNYYNIAASNYNIEKADWLQIKYAIIIDVPVEQLDNKPLLQEIEHWWGTRYCMGGNDEACIDCSAFTQTLLYKVYGEVVPRTAHEQYDFSTRIDDADLKEGDLVFFKSGRYITHVGLYVGNYKFVHAATSEGVTISDLNDAYWSKKYAGAGRVQTSSNTSLHR